jgi:hypothetical protein
MQGRSRRIVLTLLGGSALIAVALVLAGLLVWDVFLVLLVPVIVLVLVRVRPALHWTLFVVIEAATVLTLLRIEQSESSTAGFGLIVVPFLLSLGIVLAAVLDRLRGASLTEDA